MSKTGANGIIRDHRFVVISMSQSIFGDPKIDGYAPDQGTSDNNLYEFGDDIDEFED